ncbi:MAG: ComEC/Rec2 family competence protein [Eubacterium sp.]|nr:ComEC/Rec2 family competence protein [Eubacterium sp.]
MLLFCCLLLGALWALGYYAGGGLESAFGATKASTNFEGTIYIKSNGIAQDTRSKEMFAGDFGEPGTYLIVRGKLEELPGSTNPGSFDMEQYYAGKGIRYELEVSKSEVISGKKNRVVNGLYHMKCWMAERIDDAFLEFAKSEGGSNDAAVLKTMILGDKSDLSNETKILYQRSGIIHILAISGLHVGLLASILEWLLVRLKVRKNKAVVIIMIVAVLYGIMTGFSDATMRAVLMLIIGRIAFLVGRTPDLPTSMVEALLIMVIHNPDSLFSTGMLMSYMAVMGVVTGEMLIHQVLDRRSFKFIKKLRRKGRIKGFVEGVIISVSINLWMLPLIMRTYYEVPVFSLLLNQIIIPLLTFVVAMGMLVAILGPYSMPFVWGCHMLLKFYEWLCRLFISLPGAIVITGHVEIWQMGLMYLLIAVLVVSINLLLSKRKKEFAFWFERRVKDLEDEILVMKNLKEGVNDEEKPDDSGVKVFSKKNRRLTWIVFRKRLSKYVGWRSYVLVAVFASFAIVSALEIGGVKLLNKMSAGITFLDVGQGDGSIIRTGNRCYMVDGGSTSYERVGDYTIIPALKYYGVSRVDCAFISHMDLDHMSGVAYLLENQELYGIEVDYVAVSKDTDVDENYSQILEAMFSSSGEITESMLKLSGDNTIDLSSQQDLLKKVKEKMEGTKLLELSEGDVIDDKIYVLYPGGGEGIEQESRESESQRKESQKKEVEHSGNDYSLVFSYIYSGVEVLYTGDISSEVEPHVVEAMRDETYLAWKESHDTSIRNASGKDTSRHESSGKDTSRHESSGNDTSISILKCPHHGSKYSSSTEFLDAVSPDITVVSCGRYNNYGHPSSETLDRLADVGSIIYRTDQTGAIRIRY